MCGLLGREIKPTCRFRGAESQWLDKFPTALFRGRQHEIAKKSFGWTVAGQIANGWTSSAVLFRLILCCKFQDWFSIGLI
jgi:hypothetical protein